jgi:cytochrome b pre-mRNA-processing protein 3
MMVFDLFKRSSGRFSRPAVKDQANNLLAAAMRGSRDPAMYGPGRIPDSFAGRFEAVTMVATLVSARLGDIGEEAFALNQAFVNALFKSFDDALREDGVGDLTVPKKMQKIAEAFYGRAAAYRTAFEQLDAGEAGGCAALEEALFRNVLRSGEEVASFSKSLAAHAIALRSVLSALSLDQLSAAAIAWPDFPGAEGTV